MQQSPARPPPRVSGARTSGRRIRGVHRSEGEWLPEGTPLLPGRSGVCGSSLSRGNVRRASPWLWRLRETQAQMKATCPRSPRLTRVVRTGGPAARTGEAACSAWGRRPGAWPAGEEPPAPSDLGGRGEHPAAGSGLSTQHRSTSGVPHVTLSSTYTDFQSGPLLHPPPLMPPASLTGNQNSWPF